MFPPSSRLSIERSLVVVPGAQMSRVIESTRPFTFAELSRYESHLYIRAQVFSREGILPEVSMSKSLYVFIAAILDSKQHSRRIRGNRSWHEFSPRFLPDRVSAFHGHGSFLRPWGTGPSDSSTQKHSARST